MLSKVRFKRPSTTTRTIYFLDICLRDPIFAYQVILPDLNCRLLIVDGLLPKSVFSGFPPSARCLPSAPLRTGWLGMTLLEESPCRTLVISSPSASPAYNAGRSTAGRLRINCARDLDLGNRPLRCDPESIGCHSS